MTGPRHAQQHLGLAIARDNVDVRRAVIVDEHNKPQISEAMDGRHW
jgi:hypothetical protein